MAAIKGNIHLIWKGYCYISVAEHPAAFDMWQLIQIGYLKSKKRGTDSSIYITHKMVATTLLFNAL